MLNAKLTTLILTWAIFVAGGFACLMVYSNTPSEQQAPDVGGEGVRQLLEEILVPGKFNLVMGVHPKCPCTASSIGELERLIAKCRDELECRVLVYRPESANEEWSESANITAAERLPFTKVLVDKHAAFCKLLNIKTSGAVLLFGKNGELLFRGGITSARGHHGDNIGSDAILSLVRDGFADRDQCHVYGCSIFGEND